MSDTPEEHDATDSAAAKNGEANPDVNDADAAPETKPPPPWLGSDTQFLAFALSGQHEDVHREDSLGNHWSVPWSDLMMVMFILFAALVTAQALERKVPEFIDRDKEKLVAQELLSNQPSLEPLTRLNVFEKSRQAIRDANIENVEIALMEDQSVKVSVQGPLFFDRGDDELRAEVKQFLNTLAGVIRQTRYKVNVIGHTDNTPISNARFASNWELSLMRATQVTKHLIHEGQIEAARFTIMGRSEYDPATPNADNRRRSLNRRVEIIITRELSPAMEQRT